MPDTFTGVVSLSHNDDYSCVYFPQPRLIARSFEKSQSSFKIILQIVLLQAQFNTLLFSDGI